MRSLLSKKVILMVGKGGVGRTTLSAALAQALAKQGKRVLVAEIADPMQGYSALGRLFDEDNLSAKICRLAPNVDGCVLWSREGQSLFLHTVLPSAIPVRRVLNSKALSSLLDAAPSLNEMGIFYHLLELMRGIESTNGSTYEQIIVDMPATGHALALTSLPEILLRLLPDGAIADLLKEGQRYMYDGNHTVACVVTLPETLPITESLELMDGLMATHVNIGGVLLNRFPDDPFSDTEKTALSGLLEQGDFYGQASYQRIGASRRAHGRLEKSTEFPIWPVTEYHQQGDALMSALVDELATAMEAK